MMIACDRRRERGKKGGKTCDFILKGHRHHLCILLQPAYDSRASRRISISDVRSNIKSQFSLLRARKDGEVEVVKEEEEEGSDRGERKSIRLSAFTADIPSRFIIPQLPCLSYSEVYI